MIACPDCGHANIDGTEDCESCSAPLSALSQPRPLGDLPKKILDGTIAKLNPRKAVSIEAGLSVRAAVELMRGRKTGCLLVTADGAVAGILSERDLIYSAAGRPDWQAATVGSLMHADPLTLKADDPVSYAFHHMSVGGYRHLPITLEDGSVGIVSARDLLRYLTL